MSFNDVGGVNIDDGVGSVDGVVIASVVDVGVDITSAFNNGNDVVNGVGVNEVNPESVLDQAPPIEIVGILDQTPPIRDVNTPNHSFDDDSGSNTSLCGSESNSQSSHNDIAANNILKDIRIKNVNRLIIGTLNINFIAPKFEQLKEVIGNHLDIFTIQETKIDDSFPEDQFEIEGYHKPYRLDRNKHGGGVLIYVREDIPTKPLNKHKFAKNIEGIFIEINLRKTKLLFSVYIGQKTEIWESVILNFMSRLV